MEMSEWDKAFNFPKNGKKETRTFMEFEKLHGPQIKRKIETS